MSRTAISRPRIDSGAAVLWASAFIILALIIGQAGRLPGVSPAYAGNVSEIGDLTILTANSGDQEDILCILDRRSEQLFIYGVKNRQSVELVQTYNLAQTFTDARRAAGR